MSTSGCCIANVQFQICGLQDCCLGCKPDPHLPVGQGFVFCGLAFHLCLHAAGILCRLRRALCEKLACLAENAVLATIVVDGQLGRGSDSGQSALIQLSDT